jgi:amidophosphoribosyltransferase
VDDGLHHECGLVALYDLTTNRRAAADAVAGDDLPPPSAAARTAVRMLLDVQNRGQLAAGVSAYAPGSAEPIRTFKAVGTVREAFSVARRPEFDAILEQLDGIAAIGHTRYATSGHDDDVRYAQPFERRHGRLWKWFTLAFNGNLANYHELRDRLLSKEGYHFSLDSDTEVLMHYLSNRLRGETPPDLVDVMASLAAEFDGAYNIAFLDAQGRMFLSRDPLGFHPLSFGEVDGWFVAANESVALRNLGVDEVRHLAPGEMVIVEEGRVRVERFAAAVPAAKCFFEWVYFAHAGSEIDGEGVYRARSNVGRALAADESVGYSAADTIVVPVPDTAKPAADAFAYALHLPCVEGVLRNRYIGRTFIEPASGRSEAAERKYTVVPEVLEGKRVFLVEDSIVRSLTLRVLVHQLREKGHAREVHVRVASPPIVAPCFYGVNMSTLDELFAPPFVNGDYEGVPDQTMLDAMAVELNVDSLRYFEVPELGKAIGVEQADLCTACVTQNYPTPAGTKAFRAQPPD